MTDLEALGLNGRQLVAKCGQQSAVVEIERATTRERTKVDGRRTVLGSLKV